MGRCGAGCGRRRLRGSLRGPTGTWATPGPAPSHHVSSYARHLTRRRHQIGAPRPAVARRRPSAKLAGPCHLQVAASSHGPRPSSMVPSRTPPISTHVSQHNAARSTGHEWREHDGMTPLPAATDASLHWIYSGGRHAHCQARAWFRLPPSPPRPRRSPHPSAV